MSLYPQHLALVKPWWYLHPSSGAHVTVSTVSVISKIVTATFRERDWTGTAVHIDVVPRLRNSGATPLRPFIVWTETTSRFTLHRRILTQETFSQRMADSF